MERVLEEYLDKIDRRLHPMAASERLDIVREISSEMQELSAQGLSPQEITARLGDPKSLAAAYLQDAITKNPRFSWRRLGAVAAFYSLAGLGGMVVLPVTTLTAAVFMVCGALLPAAALVKMLAYFVGIDLPFVTMQLGTYVPSPVMAFPIAVVVGLLLLWAGTGCWKLTVRFVRMVGELRRQSCGPGAEAR